PGLEQQPSQWDGIPQRAVVCFREAEFVFFMDPAPTELYTLSLHDALPIYLMSAYSAVSFGHAHPKIVGALTEQAQKLGVTSRAYFNDKLPLLFERLAKLTGLDRVLPSNGGAEAVETAIKASRKWGYKIKGIA